MQRKPRALVTTGVAWLASLYPPQSSQLQNKKTAQHISTTEAPSGAPLVSQAGLPSSFHPTSSDLTPAFLSGVGDAGPGVAGAPGVVSAWGRGCGPRRAASGVGTKPPRNGHGWGFVSPRHLGHRVSKKQKQDLSVAPRSHRGALASDQAVPPGKGAAQDTPKDSPKVKSAAKAPRSWTLPP